MRAAIKQLVDKGLLIRRQGMGTPVAPKPVRRAVALTSLYDDLKESGREPKIRVLALEETLCKPEIAEHLGLEPNATVVRFDRLRMAEVDPITLMHSFVPVGLLEIEEENLERTGLYETFRAGGIAPYVGTQRVGARKASTEEAELAGPVRASVHDRASGVGEAYRQRPARTAACGGDAVPVGAGAPLPGP